MRSVLVALALLASLGSANAQKVSVTLVTSQEMLVGVTPNQTVFDGERITARIENEGGSAILAQADKYQVIDDFLGPGKPAVVLTGNVVLSDGAVTLEGVQAWFDPATKQVEIAGLTKRPEKSSIGVFGYSCRGTILYVNSERARPGEERLCPPERTHCYVFYCDREGNLRSRIVFQEP